MSPNYPLGLCAQLACIWEAAAPKLGNVHPEAAFDGLTYDHFVRSAAAIAPAMDRAGQQSLGRTIHQAVSSTQAAVATNTNLGIILLLAPLAARFENRLEETTIEDAKHVFEAIRLASPGGLGEVAEQDVKAAPTVALLEAMRLAQDRDMIAKQYANGFQQVLGEGLPMLHQFMSQERGIKCSILDLQLFFLAKYPDSLISRKFGEQEAEAIRQMAEHARGVGSAEARLQLDRYLREPGRRRNPGTTADLVTACLFAWLRDATIAEVMHFPWDGRGNHE